jgi:zinc transport system ATP-binding protein
LPAIELRDVSLAFRGIPVLEEVNLTIAAGDYVGLIGPNGGGKTTLLRVILGLLAPDRGEVRVFGRSPAQARGRIGYVPQLARFDTDFPIRVLDVVRMGRLRRRRLGRPFTRADREVARAALARVELLDLEDAPLGALSGGQMQRVLIARALAVEPEVLLLDEPAASLDTRVGHGLHSLLERLAGEVTVLLVSHDVGAVARSVRSVACLNRRLVFHPADELTPDVLAATYGGPIDRLAHVDRVLAGHPEGEEGP